MCISRVLCQLIQIQRSQLNRLHKGTIMSDQDTSLSDHPLMQLIAFLFNAMTVIAILGSAGLAAAALPGIWRDIKAAKTTREKGYHSMLFVMCWCMVYFVGMIILLAVDAGWWQTDMMKWWPTISFIFLDWDMSHTNSVMWDVLGSLMMVVVAFLASRQFGNEDEGIFVPHDRVFAKDACVEVMEQYNAFLLTNPRLQPEWAKGWNRDERDKRDWQYKYDLSELQDTVRIVHRTWRKQPPF
jgi:hypothetical protein